MKSSKFLVAGLFGLGVAMLGLRAQNTPVIVEAESGTLGAELATGTDGSTQFIRTTTNLAAQNPGAAARTASYTVTFPAAGTYELYARVRVGAAGADDDSFFYGNGFGQKAADADADWIMVNSLSSYGYTASTDTVYATGTGASNVWKWLKLSDFNGGEEPIKFTVGAGALTQTFQIGAREDGLDIDKFAFGPVGVYFTVANLDAGAAGTGAVPSEPYTPSGPPLATGLHKFLGGVYSSAQRTNFTHYFNQVAPENAGKWGSVEAVRDVMNWTELDAAYDLAKRNGLPFRYHVLLWGNQQPTWIASLPPAEQLAEIEEWMQAVAARYPAIDYIEVVNEPINQPPDDPSHGNYMNALGGSGTSGWDWILNAFRMARLYFPPTTKLMINEYSITTETWRMQAYVGIVNLLKAEGLIDVVGVQGHSFETDPAYTTPASTKSNLDLLAATGVPIMVTEFDIDGTSDQTQLERYQNYFPVFWDHPSVIGMTLWGYRPGTWRPTAYLVQSNGAERPAMLWLKSKVQGDRLAVFAPVSADLVAAGESVTLTSAATGSPTPAVKWQRNGSDVSGGTAATLTLTNVQPETTGLYQAVATNTSGTAASATAIVGVASTSKVIGSGEELQPVDIPHPNGNIFDQVLLQGAAETITADPGQVTRTSYIDLDDDIVQVEFSGAGTLSLVLDTPTGPALPSKYNQNINYMKGHAGIVITGADQSTNVSVFSVGRATAVNQGLFKDNTSYDGIADIAFIAISSTNGKFGGVRTSNANYFAAKGVTGVYAPNVAFQGPLFIGNITAAENAVPVIQVGSVSDARITGGDLAQMNAKAVQVGGLDQLKFTPGSDSHGNALAAKTNQAVLEENGTDVTAQIVVNP